MELNEQYINSIVKKVVTQLDSGEQRIAPNETSLSFNQIPDVNDMHGVFPDIDSAMRAATTAFEHYKHVSIDRRKKIIEAIRRSCRSYIEELAYLGHKETGLGRPEDKIHKNFLVIDKTPGVEDLVPTAFTGDHGLAIEEYAPFGVIGSITPCTNPSETIICNGIGMIAGGNSVVFNPHPSAKKISAFTVHIINEAIMAEGGPPNLLSTVAEPTIESAQELMTHPTVRLLVVTGGPAVVKAAMNSGKRVIAAGPGNPPVVVDETADAAKAGMNIVKGASLDNNIVCVVEKEAIIVDSIANNVKKAMCDNGGVELNTHQARRLTNIIMDGDHANKKFVGQNVQTILKEIGMSVDETARLAFVETDPDHPFAVTELLMPVIPFIRVKNVDDAIDVAVKLEGGRFHTAVMHSRNIDNLHKMAVKINTSIFVKNAPAYAGLGLGGEGPTSFTIASPTGEGLTSARNFTRRRRCTLAGHFRIT